MVRQEFRRTVGGRCRRCDETREFVEGIESGYLWLRIGCGGSRGVSNEFRKFRVFGELGGFPAGGKYQFWEGNNEL